MMMSGDGSAVKRKGAGPMEWRASRPLRFAPEETKDATFASTRPAAWGQNFRCFTVRPRLMSCFREAMPIFR